MANVTILGAGGFGLSLALTAYHNGHTVTVWNHSQQTIAKIRRDGERRDDSGEDRTDHRSCLCI